MKPTAQFFFFGFKVGRGKTAFLHRLFLCFLMVTISPLVPVTALVWADEAPVQGEAGVIKVQVLNSKDQPVAKAKITVTASKLQTLMPQKAQSFERVTAENGEATLPALLPGTYNMSIEAEGFEPFTERDIEVQSAAITQLSIQLTDKLTQSDTVEVKAESDKLVEQTSEPAKVVTAQVIKTSPYQSRTFDAAIPYVPNVIRGSDGKINIKG
ncbi:MAG TPA: carboxypeptidase-like regulatory domain-containing protein, partial [Acidobacteriota bacterium]|nr:carboxypeptidase-like regulatory domain-containing protein [Acidobacteriota bacterium]